MVARYFRSEVPFRLIIISLLDRVSAELGEDTVIPKVAFTY